MRTFGKIPQISESAQEVGLVQCGFSPKEHCRFKTCKNSKQWLPGLAKRNVFWRRLKQLSSWWKGFQKSPGIPCMQCSPKSKSQIIRRPVRKSTVTQGLCLSSAVQILHHWVVSMQVEGYPISDWAKMSLTSQMKKMWNHWTKWSASFQVALSGDCCRAIRGRNGGKVSNVARFCKSFARKVRKRQELSRTMLKHFIQIAEVVLDQGGHIAFEWPKGAKGWMSPDLVAFMKRQKMYLAECHGCFFGMKSSKGNPMFKPWHIATSSYHLASNLDKCRCQHHSSFKRDHAKGSESPKAAFYPEATG